MTHTELHRHLDASFRPETIAELCTELGFHTELRTSEDVKKKFWLTRQMSSLQEVLDCFVVFQNLMRSPKILERLAFETVEDVKCEGTSHVELRYSPSFTSDLSKLSWDAALDAFYMGMTRGMSKTGVKAGLICILSRDYDQALLEKSIDFAVANKDRFIGVDLAGPEEGFPCRQFSHHFQKALDAGLKVTIHAGEACGPENIWQAIDDLGATRIGHGITAIQDKTLMKRLERDSILLELCPTSNFITRSVQTFADHPLPEFLYAGVPVSINTDDPGIFGVGLAEEYSRCKEYLGLSDADLARIDEDALKHSFLRE